MKKEQLERERRARNIKAFELFLAGLNWLEVGERLQVSGNYLREATAQLRQEIFSRIRHKKSIPSQPVPANTHPNTAAALRKYAAFWLEELEKLKGAN